MKAKATLLLVLSMLCLISIQFASASGNLCVAAELGLEDETGKAVLAITGLVTGIGVEAAGILLCVNPWLGLGVAAAYAA